MLLTGLLIAASMLAAVQDKPIDLDYWAVQAEKEGRVAKQYGSGVDVIRDTLADLPHDTFNLLSSGRLSAAYGGSAEASLAPEYHLRIEPVDEQPGGRIRMRVVLEYSRDPAKTPVKAIDTRVVLTPGSKVRLGGMKLDKGELVLVISARQQ